MIGFVNEAAPAILAVAAILLAAASVLFVQARRSVAVVTRENAGLRAVIVELRAKEGQLRAVIESWPMPLSVRDRDRKRQIANKAYRTWYGLSEREVLNDNRDSVIRVIDNPEEV